MAIDDILEGFKRHGWTYDPNRKRTEAEEKELNEAFKKCWDYDPDIDEPSPRYSKEMLEEFDKI